MQKHSTDGFSTVRRRKCGPPRKRLFPLCIEEKKRCERQRQQCKDTERQQYNFQIPHTLWAADLLLLLVEMLIATVIAGIVLDARVGSLI